MLSFRLPSSLLFLESKPLREVKCRVVLGIITSKHEKTMDNLYESVREIRRECQRSMVKSASVYKGEEKSGECQSVRGCWSDMLRVLEEYNASVGMYESVGVVWGE